MRILLQLVLVLIGAPSTRILLAQGHPILDEYKATIGADKVQLSWVIKSGSTCNGIKIFRATDTAHFMQIGFISGVCGSPSSAIPYEFTDHDPVPNAINYYRLDLGGQGQTEILAVEFTVLNSRGFLLKGNPVLGNSQLHFKNEQNREVFLRIHDLNGNLVMESGPEFTDRFTLSAGELGGGVYVFSVVWHDQVLSSGRFLVP